MARKKKKKKGGPPKGLAKPQKKRVDAAPKPQNVRKPVNWDKAVSVAYLRLLGVTQEKSAQQAGCSKRSIVSWEASKWWPDAMNEARQRWLQGGDQAAMRGLLNNLVREEPQTCRWWADRRIPELSPPKVKGEFGGGEGTPLSLEISFVGSGDS